VILELANGRTVAFDRYGDADNVVVLLHGLSSDRASYGEVVDHLVAGPVARGELEVLNVDLLGHGDSGHASLDEYNAPSFAADIVALIEARVGEPVVVVGHSLGGVVAGAVAALRPDLVRGLFLEDPPYFEGDEKVRNASPVATLFPKLVAAVRELQARSAPAVEYESLVAAITAPEDLAERAEALTRWDPSTMQAAVEGIVWQGFDPEAAVSCPLTILRADPAMNAVFKPEDAPRVLAANPHANIVFVPGAAHNVHNGPTKARYLAELDAFRLANRR
jgi:pimeloyl-ACP methyl ester carboxylesterase